MADKRKLLAEEKNLLNQIQSRQSELNSLLEQNVEDERAREKSLSIQARLKEKIVELEGVGGGRKLLAEELKLNRQIESVQSRLLAVQRQSFETEQEFEALLSQEYRLLQELADLEQTRANTTESTNKSLNQQANLLEGLAEGAIGKVDSLLGRVPLLGDTLSQTFRESTGDLTSQIGNTFVQSGGKAKQFGKLFGGISRGIGAALRVALGPIGILLAVVAAVAAVVKQVLKFDETVQNIRKNLGITNSEATKLAGSLMLQDEDRLNAQLEVIQQINDELGFIPKITRQTADEIDDLRHKFKLTAEEAVGIVKINMLSGKTLKQFNNELEATLKAENKINKVSVGRKAVVAEIANLSASTRLAFRGQTDELIKQIAATDRIGINMKRARDIASGMLDIESSLQAQFELESFLQTQLSNAGRARMLMLDTRTRAEGVELVLQDIQRAGGLDRTDFFTQQALEKFTGLSIDELAAVQEKSLIINEKGQTEQATQLEDVRSLTEKSRDILIDIRTGIFRIANDTQFRGKRGEILEPRFETESEPNTRTG